jgi:hypothetical protein
MHADLNGNNREVDYLKIYIIINLEGLWETTERLKKDGSYPYMNSKGASSV